MDLSLHSICDSITEEDEHNELEAKDVEFAIKKDYSNEMISNENDEIGGDMIGDVHSFLLERLDDLERRVQSQENELMCLRSSTAEAIRRLNGLEKSLFPTNNTPTTVYYSPMSAATTTAVPTAIPTPKRQTCNNSESSRASTLPASANHRKTSRNRVISRSVLNLHTYTPKNRLNNGSVSLPPRENGNCNESKKSVNVQHKEHLLQTYPRSRQYLRENGDRHLSNQAASDAKITLVPMRKWMSSADVICSERRESTTNHLISCNRDSRVGISTANLSRLKSTNKIGSTNSLNVSQFSLPHFGLELREPLFVREKSVLQLWINGKMVQLPAPNSVTDLDPLRELDAPGCQPTLDWVYGYRGKDCRGNLYDLPTGEIVYFTGTIVVLHNLSEKIQRYYTKHTSDIRCMDIHPNKLLIATGQTSRRFLEKTGINNYCSPISSVTELNNILETDQYQAHVRIWDSVTLQTLRTIGLGEANANFERGVQCCSFSHASGGILLAVVDDSYEHTLSIWEWQKGKKIAETKSANDQVFACEFHPQSRNVLISYGKGHFNIWTIDGTTLIKKPLTFEGRNKPKLVLCSCFTECGHIITGDTNGTLTLWDSSQAKVIRQAVKAHIGGVWALCVLGNGYFISGGKDRMLLMWETNSMDRVRAPVMLPDEGSGCIRTIVSGSGSVLFIGTTKNTIWKGSLDNGFTLIQQGHADGVKQIAAHPTKPQFLSSSTDNTLRFCDAETKTALWSLHVEDGICCVDFHPEGNTFAVGFMSGIWAIYDLTQRTQYYAFKEGADAIATLRFSSNGSFLAVATKGKILSVYAISGDFRHYVKAAEIKGLKASIRTIDWSTNLTLLRANDDDFQYYIWDSTTGQPASLQELGTVQWNSSRCIVSFENACILCASKGMVTSIERSPDGQYVAVCLSNGVIRFYQYPTTTILASYKEALGSSICTRNIAFAGGMLLSDGATDGTIYQWKL